jgi:hypothetical protein
MLKSLDVAIGLAFLFLLVTFVASALVEIISTIRNWRAEMLCGAIGNMLAGSQLMSVTDVYNSPLVTALGQDDAAPSWVDLFKHLGWRPTGMGPQPSYMPAATFSACVVEHLNRTAPQPTVPSPAPSPSPDATIQALHRLLAAKVPQDPQKDGLRSILETTLATQGPSVQAVKLAIEKWYNDTMDRATGWYKRRTQSCLLMIGLLMALGGNIDTIQVGMWLWQGDAARQAVVSAATDYLKNNQPPAATSNGKDSLKKAVEEAGAQVITADSKLASLQYPIGWPHVAAHPMWFLQYLIGTLITAIAISMGSPFWFDALQSLLKMRGTGPKPGAR